MRITIDISVANDPGAHQWLDRIVHRIDDGWHVWDLTDTPDANAIKATTWFSDPGRQGKLLDELLVKSAGLDAWTLTPHTRRLRVTALPAGPDELAPEQASRLADEPLSGREVDAAISHITGSMVFAKEDMETRMKRLAGQYQMFGRVIEMDQAASLLRSVTAQDVAALTERLVRPGQFNLLAYGTRNMNDLRRVPFDW